MSEIIDAIRNMPPAAADVLWLSSVVLGSGALGFALGFTRRCSDDDAGQPTPRRSERRRWRK